MKSATLARLAQPARTRRAQMTTLPAPMAGWFTAGNLASMPQGTAMRLENWRPTNTGIVQRGGSKTRATISDGTKPVESFISYNATQKKLFAATRTDIFDVTTVANPNVPPPAAVSGQTSGYYSFVNFTTSGDEYLTAVNGTDALLLYHPSSGWKKITDTSSPAITGGSTATLSFVWVYRNRQFFIEGGGLRARYLPVASIAGALGTIDLNGVFQRGGSLMFGASWSIDAGDGLDDKCVFVTNQGEIAVYQGGDPATAAGFVLVGRYDLARPLGPRATMRVGGDLLIATEMGLLPLSQAITKDISVLDQSSVSRAISPDWRREAKARRSLPWEIVKWPERAYALVSLPVTNGSQQGLCYVLNTETGAWCTFTGWDARCLIFHNGEVVFGTNKGKVKDTEVTGTDDGVPIYYTCVANPDHLETSGVLKTILQARATLKRATPNEIQLSGSTDYRVKLPAPPNPAPDVPPVGIWGSGRWDQALWDATMASAFPDIVKTSIGMTGYVFQWQLQVTGAQSSAPMVELVSVDVSFETGGPAL